MNFRTLPGSGNYPTLKSRQPAQQVSGCRWIGIQARGASCQLAQNGAVWALCATPLMSRPTVRNIGTSRAAGNACRAGNKNSHGTSLSKRPG
jgi:hypothetical protein